MKKYAFLVGILVLTAALLTGCAGAGGAAEGDSVQVHYTGTLDDGTAFDSSEGGEPLAFVIGDGTVIAGFDKAVRGMEVGDTKKFTVPADEAYGEYRQDLLAAVPRDELEADIAVGDRVMLQNIETEEVLEFTVIEITDTEVILDANHALAGQDLTFEIELVALEPAGDITDNPEE